MTFPRPEDVWARLLAAPAALGASDARYKDRSRLLAGCAFLVAVAFHMAPGMIIAETKLDMPVNPLGFLARALHMWEPAYLGQLQNQAYGYLFPMGPFYLAGGFVGLEPWVIQRLWVALVLCVAYAGVTRLVRAMRIGGTLAGAAAGLAYALAPHAQTLLGFNSVEFLPSAVLPWIMLPLVLGCRGDLGPRRAASLSALAFVGAGGINASAELAVLVVPGLYLLTRGWGPRQRRLVAWWAAAITAVSLWWVAPLVLLGRYVFSFMPYTENAFTTTLVGSLTNALRGVNDWVAFLPVDGKPYLPAGYEHAYTPWLIVVTALLAGLGLGGLALRRTPERAFLVITLLVGTAVVVAGHAGPLAPLIRDLLDGELAPFRNLHKFNALIRLPLALGLAALAVHVARLRPVARLPVTVAGAGLVGLSLVPVATAGIAPAGAFSELPGYWRDATSWLDERAGLGTVLAVPGVRRGEYLWGRPIDEPLQPLLRQARWAVNTNVPWGSAGASRLIDAIDDRFATGRGSAGLTAVLRRIGVRYVLVRNDLDRVALGGAWPSRVHEALARSPGLERVRGFGPAVGYAETSTAGGWLDQPYAALEVYEVTGAAPVAGTVDERAVRVLGGPEAVLTMAEEGVLTGDRPVLLGEDPGDAGEVVVTDTMRRRDLSISDLRRAAGPTLTAGEPFESLGPVEDLIDPAWAEPKTTARLDGVRRVRASSSEAGLGALPSVRDPGRAPFAALDADTRTGWRSSGWEPPEGEWLEVEFDAPTKVAPLRAVFDDSHGTARVTEVIVRTDAGTARTRVDAHGTWQKLNVREGVTTRLRVTVAAVAPSPATRVGLLELEVPGVRPGRTLVVPDAPDAFGDALVVTSRTDGASACTPGSYAWTCAEELRVIGDDGGGFDRSVPVTSGAKQVISGRATLVDQRLAERMLALPGVRPKVGASSTLADVPISGAWAAFDGDPRTVWYASDKDLTPTLTAELGKTVRLSRLKIDFPDLRLGAPPVRVTIETDGGTRQAWASADGWIDFAPLRASRVKLVFSPVGRRNVEVVGVTLPGIAPLPGFDEAPLRVPCGLGPELTVDGGRVRTEIVSGTIRDLLEGRPLGYRSCGEVQPETDRIRVRAAPVQAFRVDSAVVGTASAAPVSSGSPMKPAEVRSWGAGERRLAVSTDRPSYLVVNENFNRGWEARADGRALTPVRLDGWRQAWRLPPTDGEITIVYAPDRLYHAFLVAGGLLVLLVLGSAVVRRRDGAGLHRTPPAPLRATWLWPLAPLLGYWAAGWGGAAVALGTCVLALWCRTRTSPSDPTGRIAAVIASPWAVAGAVGLAGPATAYGGALGALGPRVADAACLVALGLLTAAIGLPERSRPRGGAS
ncbi:alpha-(1-_3)-arabinofuranosyltransferase family protein [Spongiactinospora sp. TRM90649]|uniref:alpha-(1->3)-arabinofuranosyltransferase domain-containing protein n=1 Tax=Spongiactinospora sp. TRM90649 TaxID=3031114 RepID=UPI0023F8E5FE|nr:alpha-(1->3)-arabinofuranosyltransferase family protein [Spongiactinospora sp. TRM90649]MDF5751059.1 alpha-(1->3)-arabinofuranosyltransferase family protein [Spongiactinospora sp. TRM90649]